MKHRITDTRSAGVTRCSSTPVRGSGPQASDPFCHYNELGNEMLAETVANLIGDALVAHTGADRRD